MITTPTIEVELRTHQSQLQRTIMHQKGKNDFSSTKDHQNRKQGLIQSSTVGSNGIDKKNRQIEDSKTDAYQIDAPNIGIGLVEPVDDPRGKVSHLPTSWQHGEVSNRLGVAYDSIHGG